MALTLAQVEAKALANEQAITDMQTNTVSIPTLAILISDTKVSDKTGWVVYGTVSGINGGNFFMGRSSVANPTLDADISEFIHRKIPL